MEKIYNWVITGGTFDHFHRGHQSLIDKSFTLSQNVLIGITEDSFISHKNFSNQIQTFNIRKKVLEEYLISQYPNRNFELVKIKDIYGPAIFYKHELEAIIVGPKTVKRAQLVNVKRKEAGLKKIPIIKARFIKSDDGKYISSTRIRAGEINQDGFLYKKLFTKDIKVHDHFRKYLKKVHGEEISSLLALKNIYKSDKNPFIVWVGDSVGKKFVEKKIPFDFGIFDLKTQRHEELFFAKLLKDSSSKILKSKNYSGVITKSLFKKLTVLKAKKYQYLFVKGEEDLAVVPLVMNLPLNSLVFYGIKDKGLFMVKVTKAKKEEVKKEIEKNNKKNTK